MSKSHLSKVNSPTLPSRSLSRRRMMGGMLGAAGLATLAQGEKAAIISPRPVADAAAQAKNLKKVWRPLFLDRHQAATLSAMGERIAPGSKQAKIHQFIDRLLSVLPADAPQSFATGGNDPKGTVGVGPGARQKLLDALAAFDAEARRRYRKTFLALNASQQNRILHIADQSVETSPLHRHFLNAKLWIIGAYYSSLPGMRAAGWTGQMFYTQFPNCEAVPPV